MAKYLGSKFLADVLADTLTGLSTATSTVITAADSILGALGKLQAQLTTEVSRATTAEGLLAPKAGATFTGAISSPRIKSGATGWLEAVFASTETAPDGILGMSTTGACGVTAATRSIDNPHAGAMNFSLGAFAFNNNTAFLQTTYCAYFEARRSPGTGITQGLEATVVNQGTVVEGQPYYLGDTGSTMPLWLSCGRADVSPNNDNTCALGIVGGGPVGSAQFRKGIIFQGTSCTSVSGIGGIALALPVSYATVWYANSNLNGTGIPAAFIRSSISDTTGFVAPPMIDFNGTGIDFRTADGIVPFQLRSSQVIFTRQMLMVQGNANIEMGDTGSVNTPFIDMHSSGNGNDYDVRLVASGGNATAGNGLLSVKGDLSVSRGISATANISCGPNSSYFCTLPTGSGFGAYLTTNASGDAILNNAVTSAGAAIYANSLNVAAGVEIGSTSTAGTAYVDLHSSGTANDYDVRLASSGGTSGTNGLGTLTVNGNLTTTRGITAGANVVAAANSSFICTAPSGSSFGAYLGTNAAGDVLLASLTSGNTAALTVSAVGTSVPDLNVAGTGAIAGAWATTSAAISGIGGGTISGTATLRYRKIGRTVFLNVAISGITNTNETVGVKFTVPWTAVVLTILAGRENTNTGKALQGLINGNSTLCQVLYYDNTNPGATGNTLFLGGVLETTT